jgi:hypothetical protein
MKLILQSQFVMALCDEMIRSPGVDATDGTGRDPIQVSYKEGYINYECGNIMCHLIPGHP